MNKISTVIIILVFTVMGSLLYLQNRDIRDLQQKVKYISDIACSNSKTLSNNTTFRGSWSVNEFIALVHVTTEKAREELYKLGFEPAPGSKEDITWLKGPGTATVKMDKTDNAFEFTIIGKEVDILRVAETVCHNTIDAAALARAKDKPFTFCVVNGRNERFILYYYPTERKASIIMAPITEKEDKNI